MICSYKYTPENGQEMSFESYTDLLDWLSGRKTLEKIDSLPDIVYSREQQLHVIELLKDLKANYIPIDTWSIINGEPGVKDSVSVLDFIDMCKLGTPYNVENHKLEYVNKQQQKRNLSKEEAEKEFDKLYLHEKTVQSDAFHLHSLFTNSSIWDPKKLEFDFLTNISSELKNRLEEPTIITKKLYRRLNQWYYQNKGYHGDTMARSNINLSSKVKLLGIEVFGHIDYMFVGDDGTLHIYLFKTSETEFDKWPSVKKNRYKRQLAILRAMLKDNGINADNVTLNIVPVLIKYNNETDKISNIIINETINMSSGFNLKYSMASFDREVEPYFEDNSMRYHISEDHIKVAVDNTKLMFLNLYIQRDGIMGSVKTWIANAPSEKYQEFPIAIKFIGEPDHGYDLYIGDKIYKIKSSKDKNKNEEILNTVKEHVEEILSNLGYYTRRLKEAIRYKYKHPTSSLNKFYEFKNHTTQLQLTHLYKYFSDITKTTDKNGNEVIEYNWELLDNLLDCNVLVFRNKKTKVVDVIGLSAFDLRAKAPFNIGTSILGDFKRDINYIDLEGTYGNIEIVKTMNLINEILPELGNVKLGTIGALNTSISDISMITYNISEFNLKYYQTILKETGIKSSNNFNKALFYNVRDEILDTYSALMKTLEDYQLEKYSKYGFEEYLDSQDVSALLHALELIMNNILLYKPKFSNYEILKAELHKKYNDEDKQIAILYEMVTRAYLSLRGEVATYQIHLDETDMNFMTAPTVADPNIRIVVNNLQITHDTISSEFLNYFDSKLRPKIYKYYEKIGYTSGLNMSIGNLALQYSNLYNTEDDLFSFKNPYDTTNDLKPEERELLKFALFLFAKIREVNSFNFSSENDPKIAEYILKHPEYLWVPLEKASKATRRLSKEAVVAGMKNFWRRATNAVQNFDETINDMLPEERFMLSGEDLDFYTMHLTNPFDASLVRGINDLNNAIYRRRNMLKTHKGWAYFETNLENLLIDVLALLIATKLFQKYIVGTKALLLHLNIMGEKYGTQSIINKEINYILDYLKVNVFRTSILGNTEKKLVGVVLPVKQVVTDMLLGGNVGSMIRDLIEGGLQEMMLPFTKLNSDLTATSLRKAYNFVARNSTSNAMAVNLLGKLCLKYRLSNTDVGRIAERAKSGRNGILNFETWLYGTLRSPDFLHRMTLFVARCIQDGVLDVDNLENSAFYIDKNDNLLYDWKKDKRFNIFADPKADKNSLKYKELKALYLSKILLYKKEHPGIELENNELLSPYTNLEIMTIRALGDRIFGSYDKGKKARWEYRAEGILLGMFSTWMNGIANTYFMKPLKNNVTKLQKVQETNEYGDLLFFDENGNILTLEEGGDPNMRVWKDEPVIILGIYYTTKTLIQICRKEGKDAIKEYLKANPLEQTNLKKLISDLLMWLFFGTLYTFVLDPAYKEFKKEGSKRTVLENLTAEILYKPSSRAYDLFKGPFNIISFFGENNLPYYSVPVSLMTDAGKSLFGDTSWKYLVLNNLGITRSFKDTTLAYIKSQEASNA